MTQPTQPDPKCPECGRDDYCYNCQTDHPKETCQQTVARLRAALAASKTDYDDLFRDREAANAEVARLREELAGADMIRNDEHLYVNKALDDCREGWRELIVAERKRIASEVDCIRKSCDTALSLCRNYAWDSVEFIIWLDAIVFEINRTRDRIATGYYAQQQEVRDGE